MNSVDFRIEIGPGNIKTFHINMITEYVQRGSEEPRIDHGEVEELTTKAAVACILDDGKEEHNISVERNDVITLYNGKRTQIYKDVDVNPKLSTTRKQERVIQRESVDVDDLLPGNRLHEIEVIIGSIETETPEDLRAMELADDIGIDVSWEVDRYASRGNIDRAVEFNRFNIGIKSESGGSENDTSGRECERLGQVEITEQGEEKKNIGISAGAVTQEIQREEDVTLQLFSQEFRDKDERSSRATFGCKCSKKKKKSCDALICDIINDDQKRSGNRTDGDGTRREITHDRNMFVGEEIRTTVQEVLSWNYRSGKKTRKKKKMF